jgi:hypothetical protein
VRPAVHSPPARTSRLAVGSISISWNDISGESNYRIERSTNGTSFSTLATVAANVTSYTDASVTGGTEYYYRVWGTTSLTQSLAGSVKFAAAPSASPPPAPWSSQDIGAVYGPGTTDLTGGTFKLVSSGLDIGGTQQYTATARDQFGDSMVTQPSLTWTVSGGGTINSSTGLFTAGTTPGGPFTVTAASGSVSGTALVTIVQAAPTAPTNLSASSVSGSQINLTWTDRSNNETGPRIDMLINGVWTQIGTVGANVTSFSVTGQPLTTYSFRVAAFNDAGLSAYSNTASAKTKKR